MTATATRVRALTVETTPLDSIRQLIPYLDAHRPLLWLRRGDGMAGIGEALRLEFSGPDRVAEASRTWAEIVSSASVSDSVGVSGTGLIAFGTFAFADSSDATSVLIVPEIIIGRRNGNNWITRVRPSGLGTIFPDKPEPTALGDEYRLTMLPGSLKPDDYRAVVAAATERIRSGEISKVVIARGLHAHLPHESDLRRALVELALGYPDCWTYAVDGLVGTSPETLVSVRGGELKARVLAGTISRGTDAVSDHQEALALSTSSKDVDEHRYAVESVLAALGPHSNELSANDVPFTLKLPNLWHLATDVSGILADGSSSLDLVASLHPTAAVAGTPTPEALRVISELEPVDRGRYSGPVGWIDAAGDGEWAIALRGAQVDPDGNITAFAGCGIMGDSVPDLELAETKMKFRPIVEAFG